MDLTPDHLSASRIKTWLTCPMKYRLTYVDRVPWAFKPAALVLGISVHAAVEAYHGAHMNGTTLSPTDLKAVFDETWTTELDTDLPLDADDPDTIRTQGHALLDVFAEHAAPRTILAVEETFRVPLSIPESDAAWESDDIRDIHPREHIYPELPVDLVGRLDLVEADGDGTPVIVDLKTLSRKPSEIDLRYDVQLMTYAYTVRRTGMVALDKDVLLRLDVLTKTKVPAFSQHFVVRSPDSDHRFVALASEIKNAIQAGVFPPNPGWQCGGCPVGHACSFGS